MALSLFRKSGWWWLGGLLLFGLFGCGGTGSSSDQPAATAVPTQLVAGFVEDGPIVDARIYLADAVDGSVVPFCGPSGQGRCETRSDDAGHFSLLLARRVDPGTLLLVARGGSDGGTGFDFSAMEQCSALDFYASSLGRVVVSPLTTLVTRGWQSGLSLADSLQVVADNLQLSGSPSKLLSRPAEDAQLLNRTLLLSKIAAELVLQDPAQEPFARLAAQLVAPPASVFSSGFPDSGLLNDLGFVGDARQRIEDMRLALAGNGDQRQSFIVEELFQGIRTIVERSLGSGFDPLDPAFIANGHTLAMQVAQAVAPALVPLNRVAPQRLARYLLHAYGLNDAVSLSLPGNEFNVKLQGGSSSGLSAVTVNPLLRELASLTSAYSIQVPLLADEMPGDDSARRAAYYYRSDLSHLHQAEKLVGLVSDDAVNDPLMVEIVDGKAAAGLFAEAEKIVQTQIYQSAEQADAWLELGRSEVDFGRYAAALPHLDAAYAAIRRVVDSKGAALLSSHDSAVLASIAANYRKIGDLDDAARVLDYLQQLATAVASTSTYGKFFIGVRNIAEDALAADEIAQATAMVNDLLPLARLTPANKKVRSGVTYMYYRSRIFNLSEVLRLNADLGRSAEVWQIYQEIESLRANDGLQNLTLNETWYYASQIVEDLYRSGFAIEALNLANSIPVSYKNYYGATRSGVYYQNAAFMSVATWEALNNGYASGLQVLNDHFSAASDLIEGLTYYALNRKNERIGLSLINVGRLGEAVQALDEAARLLGGLTETSDRNIYRNLIERGYVKVADLYADVGDFATAATLLGRAEGALQPVVGVSYRIDGLVSIALGYHRLGMVTARDGQFSQAYDEIRVAQSLVSRTEETQLYETLADGIIESGQRGGVLQQVADAMSAAAADIHDPVRDAGLSNYDSLARTEIKYLLKTAGYYSLMKNSADALLTLQLAEQTAGSIQVDTTRMKQLVAIAGALAGAGFSDQAIALAESLSFVSSRNDALQAIAESFSRRDDFPGTKVAAIDTDGDGLPNFWSPLASAADIAASGLMLDPDCDNDGIPDISDHRPLYVDP
ncbi:tetratricopeptide repeat protein [Geothermobacter hydrogeniphilus]|uniref:Tetratricopeptide repeat-containing protein n=1 Tax=Geothermobacter hydrogeniphilus TaxID=1969733 RepID=A0A1X0Y383_9BACT|nr:tetratricopeptide repeat protein [Geothermobacter hydrogeniphilus]ORJ59606.1 hypothetical protein B5V00_10005 [Geothermobacter hydrogeniphilus]